MNLTIEKWWVELDFQVDKALKFDEIWIFQLKKALLLSYGLVV